MLFKILCFTLLLRAIKNRPYRLSDSSPGRQTMFRAIKILFLSFSLNYSDAVLSKFNS